jgi:hypothetical protein
MKHSGDWVHWTRKVVDVPNILTRERGGPRSRNVVRAIVVITAVVGVGLLVIVVAVRSSGTKPLTVSKLSEQAAFLETPEGTHEVSRDSVSLSCSGSAVVKPPSITRHLLSSDAPKDVEFFRREFAEHGWKDSQAKTPYAYVPSPALFVEKQQDDHLLRAWIGLEDGARYELTIEDSLMNLKC